MNGWKNFVGTLAIPFRTPYKPQTVFHSFFFMTVPDTLTAEEVLPIRRTIDAVDQSSETDPARAAEVARQIALSLQLAQLDARRSLGSTLRQLH